MEIERNSNTDRERRHISTLFSISMKQNFGIRGVLDRTLESTSKGSGESKGGVMEAAYNSSPVFLRAYLEAREYKKDSAMFNPGYGVITYGNSGFNSLRMRAYGEYRKFGKYEKIGAECTGKSIQEGNMDYGFALNVRRQTLPVGLFTVDNRLTGRLRGDVDVIRKNWMARFMIFYMNTKSTRIASMNFQKLRMRLSWNMIFYRDNRKSTGIKGHAGYLTRHFTEGGIENIMDYGFLYRFAHSSFFVESSVNMKRFDYFSLVPLDRDERSISLRVSLNKYSFSFERLDINYIRSQYVSNSRSMKKFEVSSENHNFNVRGIKVRYSGRLFAGIFTPIYTNDLGFYQRYWENRILCNTRDSLVSATLSIRYKQFGEFKNDSIYTPSWDLEYINSLSLKVFSSRNIRTFIRQYSDVLNTGGTREWKIGIRIETETYNFEAGVGMLMGRENSYLEFEGWI